MELALVPDQRAVKLFDVLNEARTMYLQRQVCGEHVRQ